MTSISESSLCFERHNLFGGKAPDGEPWPFGYISTSPTPQPIFELNVPLQFPRKELRTVAVKLGAAHEMLEACRRALLHVEVDETTHGRQFAAGNVLRAAIAKAEGRS